MRKELAFVLFLLALPLQLPAEMSSVQVLQGPGRFTDAFVIPTRDGLARVEVKNVVEVDRAKVGTIEIGRIQYLAREYPDGRRTLERIDTTALSVGNDILGPAELTNSDEGRFAETATLAPLSNSSTTIDLLVLYEPSAAPEPGGHEMLHAELEEALAYMHRTLDNIGLPQVRFRVVGFLNFGRDVPLVWPEADIAEVFALRDAYGADLVTFILFDLPPGIGGSAQLFHGGDPQYAMNVVKRPFHGGLLAHELGHNMGLLHEPENDDGWHTLGVPYWVRSMSLCFEDDPYLNSGGVMNWSTPCPSAEGWYRRELFTGEGVYFEGVPFWNAESKQKQIIEITAPRIARYREAVGLPSGPCVPTPHTLCIDEISGSGDKRFEVTALYRTFSGEFGTGSVQSAFALGGNFYFFSPENPELLVKVINGCGYPDPPLADHFWVYLAALTNLEFTVTIRDSITGRSHDYTNDLGVTAQSVTDISTFLCQ